MSTGRRVLFVAVAIGMLSLLAWRLALAAQRVTAPIGIDLAFTTAPEAPWGGTEHLVADARAGHRPRRSFVERSVAAPLGEPDQLIERETRTCPQGLVRADDLGTSIPGPRVLVLGDEMTIGGVSTDSIWPARLEATLRARGDRFTTTTVLDAACDQYGLAHHVLRGPELVVRYEPRVVVLALATGDDVVALDDRRLPHLDDAALPAGPAFPPIADPLALRARATVICPDHPELALRGLAQAGYRRAVPDREPLLDRKLRQCIGWMRDLAPRASLLAVLIPPVDLARADEAAPLCSEPGRELIASGIQARAHEAVVTALQARGVAYVDLLPELRAATGPDVYRTDGCLGETGHRIVAEQITERVVGLVNRR